MKRSRKSADWRNFIHRAAAANYEVITRIGDPVIIHKKDTPFSTETVAWVFAVRKGGRWTKKQIQGINILTELGQKVVKYVPKDEKAEKIPPVG